MNIKLYIKKIKLIRIYYLEFNKIEGTNFTYKDVYFDMDFCERCGKNTECVVGICQEDSEQERDDID